MFIFLKILLSFFRPLVWIIVLFLIGLLTKNVKRRMLFYKIAFISLLFFSNPFIIRKLATWYEVKPVQLAPTEKYSAGIVLGGFITYNRNDNQGYFNHASDRFIQTALLYKNGHINKIIIPAGNGYITELDFKEANFIKEKFVELGIPIGDIIIDPYSRNTLENAINTKKIIDSTHMQGPYLLISSAMHLPRASQVFTKNGINAKLYPCDFTSLEVNSNIWENYLLPSSFALTTWDSLIKELLGTLVYKVTGKG
jgi:uncharacterized SAM-binding protein YcdF (DUF218 family)